MSAIDVASTTNGAAPASARSKTTDAGRGNGGGDGAFSQVFESVARNPSDARSAARDPASGAAAEDKTTADKTAGGKTTGADARRDSAVSRARGAVGLPATEREDVTADEKPVAREEAVASDDKRAKDDASPDEASRGRAHNAEGDLTRLLGIGMDAAAHAADAPERKSSAPLRRDVLPQLPSAEAVDGDAGERPQSARITVIGRETHFAPVNVPTQDNRQPPVAVPGAEARPAADRLPAVPAGVANKPDETAQPRDVRNTVATGEAARAGTPNALAPRTARAVSAIGLAREEARGAQQPVASAGAESAVVSGTIPEAGALVRVADQIITQARELTTAAGSAAPASGAAQPSQQLHDGGPVRILRLQLQPEELGLVTARLRIVGGVLELRITADRPQSVEVLQQDREGLIETLQRAGYKAEIASIEFARSPTPAPAQPSSHASGNGGGQQAFSQGFEGRDGGSAFSGSDRSPQGGNAGNGRQQDEHSAGGNGDNTIRHSDDPQAIYL